jgi:hypothetical protein
VTSHFYFHALIFQSESAATFSRINTALSGRGQTKWQQQDEAGTVLKKSGFTTPASWAQRFPA